MANLLPDRGLTKVVICYLDDRGTLRTRIVTIPLESVSQLISQVDELEASGMAPAEPAPRL